MNISNIRTMAKTMGIKAGRLKKEELVRSIQRAEGNRDCFNSPETRECPQTDCLWREDCAIS